MSGIMLNFAGVSAADKPGAPTIGTATATGSTTATVSYTAPASDGGSVITSYTATSSPSGITGTLSQAGSGTITVGGLSSATAYTFTVTATNSAGTSASSAASNSITTLPVIGQAFGGGFYAGQIGVSSVATHDLIVAPKSSGQSNLRWKNTATGTVGADSVINGPQNTTDIVADGDATTYPAGHFCNDLVIGGFSDWYFPAKNETEVFYYNLKPSTTNNQTFSGVNPNAVPARASTYSAGNPAQTSVAIFQTGGAEAFDITGYWSSSEKNTSSGIAFGSSFSDGYQYNLDAKNYAKRVRGARRIAV